MAKKKPPTFGQKPYEPQNYPATDPATWRPVYDITDLQHADGMITAGNSSLDNIRVAAQFLFPQQTYQYVEWAKANPTMDPRAWAPLAQGGVVPNSPQGQAISIGSLAAQVGDNGTVGASKSAPINPSGPGWVSQAAPFGAIPQQDGGGSTPGDPGPLQNFLNGVGNAIGTGFNDVVGTVQESARAVQYGLQSEWDAIQGVPRTGAGYNQKQQELAAKYGLSQEEANLAFPITPGIQAIAGKDLNTNPSNPSEHTNLEGGNRNPIGLLGAGMLNRGMVGGSSTSWDNIPDDRMALIKQVQDEWAKQAPSGADIASTVFNQTAAGQIQQNPALLHEDSGWLASNPAVTTGTTDPTTGKPLINPATGKPWTGSNQGTEKASLAAYDMRTPDEIARGIQPVGWTPGRGIAHLAWSPNEQAFNTWSGVIDFFNNLVFDPANKIPLGALGKVGKVAGKGVASLSDAVVEGSGARFAGGLGRAMATGGRKVAVQTTTPRFGTPGAYNLAREGARGKAAMDSLDIAYRDTDPGLTGKIDPQTGLVTSPHGNIVMSEPAWNFVNSGRGNEMVKALVDEKSAANLWLKSNRKIDPVLADQFAKATTEAQVRALLGTRLGMDLNDPAALRNFGGKTPAIFKDMALRDNPVLQYLRKAPQAKPFDLEDSENAATQLERFGRGAGMKWEDVAPHIDNLFAAKDAAGRYAAVYGADENGGFMEAVAKHLVSDVGLDMGDARRLTRAFKGGLDEALRNYVNTGIGEGTIGVASTDGMIGSAMLDSELLTRAAVLPDYRTVRGAATAIGRVRRMGPVSEDTNESVARLINSTTSAWKSTVLVRPAYVAREVGEMAVASALAGYDSIFTNPGAFAGMVLSTVVQKEASTAAGRYLKSFVTGVTPIERMDELAAKAEAGGATAKASAAIARTSYRTAAAPAALGNLLHVGHGIKTLFPAMDHQWARVNGEGVYDSLNKYIQTGDSTYLESMYDGMAAVAGNFSIDERMGRMAAGSVGIASATDPVSRAQYIDGMIAKLGVMSRDGDMRNLANPKMTFNDALGDFIQSGRKTRKQTAGAKNFKGVTDQKYLQGYQDLLHKLTGESTPLIQSVADGSFAGAPLIKTNKALRDHINALLDDETTKHNMLPTMRYDKHAYDKTIVNKVNNAMTRFFDGTGEISDLFMRGGLFRQAYVREVERLGTEISPAAKQEILANLRAAGDMEQFYKVKAIQANGTLQVSDVDHLAGQFARNESKRIYYDAHERQNYAVAMRAVMPFAQATFNTIRRWGELSMRNPQLMYRTLKPLNYAMQPGSAAIYGALGGLYGEQGDALYDPSSYGYSTPDTTHNSVDGFVYTDQYGDRVFTYPMIGLLGQFAGIPQSAMNTSSVSGLNVAGTSIMPGFGPSVTFPASIFGQEAIARDDFVGQAMRFMFQYNLPTGSLPDRLGASFMSSWMLKINKAYDEQGAIPNMSAKIMPTLLETGDYDVRSATDQGRLAADAAALSQRLFVWNAIVGTLTPSTINTKTLVSVYGADNTPYTTNSDSAKIADAILKADPTDKGGAYRRWIIQDKLKQEWNKYTTGAGGLQAYRDGMLHFVHDYGLTALFSVLPPTQGQDGNSPTQATNDVWHFRTTEPEAYQQNQNVIGLFFAGGSAFVPGDNSATGFATPLYTVQKQSGERQQKDEPKFIRDAMNEYGWMLWNPKVKQFEANTSMSPDQQSNAKDGLRAEIRDLTGGAWTGMPLDAGKTASLMEQLHDAVKDPTIQTLKSAPYIKQYMDFRDQILQEMHASGGTTNLTSQDNQSYAIRLIDEAKTLNQQDTTGAFNNAWQRLLSNEFGSA